MITYAVRRNVQATDKHNLPCKVALAIIRFPDGTATTLAIPEALLKTIPPDKRDDFIESEVQGVMGFAVTRQ